MAIGHYGGAHETGMIQDATGDAERKIISILEILSESSEPLGSITIARELERRGISLSERAVRYHLRITDERGYTTPAGRDGRMITAAGQEEIREAMAPSSPGLHQRKARDAGFSNDLRPSKEDGAPLCQYVAYRQRKIH